ncbi:hypothetical protein [Roseomonas gilardii]|uniref:hypothetical protein n=1 Tax=Roseomonas gilardii TaxID=257708 RepID=UPI0012DF8E1C|nr:hypothetical protein [Roseomonas gilardii]
MLATDAPVSGMCGTGVEQWHDKAGRDICATCTRNVRVKLAMETAASLVDEIVETVGHIDDGYSQLSRQQLLRQMNRRSVSCSICCWRPFLAFHGSASAY